MNTFIKTNRLFGAIIAVPLIIILICWNQFPDEIPIHWNADGEIDGYAPKSWGLFIIPLSMLFVNAIFWLLPKLDQKNSLEQFKSTVWTIQLVLNLFLLGIALITLGTALGYSFAMDTYIVYGLLIVCTVLGNYMGKLRPNYFMGIRTPWTLDSETVWFKTHRLAGKIWVGGSIFMMILKLFLPSVNFIPFMVGGILLMGLIPAFYSYFIFKQEKANS